MKLGRGYKAEIKGPSAIGDVVMYVEKKLLMKSSPGQSHTEKR